MDRRTKQRYKRLTLAAEVVERLNRAAAEYLAWQHEPAPWQDEDGSPRDVRYHPCDHEAWRLTQMTWQIRFNGPGEGYDRPVLSTDRKDGKRVSAYFHGKSRSFRVKVAHGRLAPNAQPTILDTLRVIGSGVVARCGCLRFYVRHDRRQRFCTPTCAATVRQRRHRRLERKREGKLVAVAVPEKVNTYVPPREPERNDPADRAARRAQQRMYFSKRGRKDMRA